MFATLPYRARAGAGIALRSLGKPASAFPGRVATDADLMIAVDRQQTRLAVPLDASATSMTVENAAGIVAYNLLTIDNEIVKTIGAPSGNVVLIARGFDGTTPALHLASAIVSGFVDAYHHNALAAEVEAIENALGPNLSKIPAVAVILSAAHNFAPQTPGGVLNPGTNQITLSPVPAGVNGTDAKHYLYISGGTGAAEAVLITGGTAVSGDASGAIFVTCANTHSGAWTIQSATSGIQEAVNASPIAFGGGKSTVHIQAGALNCYAGISVVNPIRITGEGLGVTAVYKAFDGGYLFDIQPQSHPYFELDHFTILGGVVTTSGGAIYAKNLGLQINSIHDLVITQLHNPVTLENARVDMSDVWITDFDGVGVSSSIVFTGQWRNVHVVALDIGWWTPTYALEISGSIDGLNFTDCEFGGAAGGGSVVYGIYIHPGAAATYISNVNMTNITIDGFTSRGIWQSKGESTLSPAVGGIWKLVNVRCAAGGGSGPRPEAYGIQLDGTLDTVQIHNLFTVEVEQGLVLGGITSLSVTGSDIRAFSSAPGGHAVVVNNLNGPLKAAQFIGNTIGYGTGGSTALGAANGIVIAAGAHAGVVIQGNTIHGNAPITGAANLTSGVIADNPGYNPVGLSAITVGGSPFTYTAGPTPEVVYVRGGTVSDIKRGATTIAAASPAQVSLPPFGTVTVTYSVLPTMVKDIL